MPGADEVGGVGGSMSWGHGSSLLSTAGWELRSLHSSSWPCDCLSPDSLDLIICITGLGCWKYTRLF